MGNKSSNSNVNQINPKSQSYFQREILIAADSGWMNNDFIRLFLVSPRTNHLKSQLADFQVRSASAFTSDDHTLLVSYSHNGSAWGFTDLEMFNKIVWKISYSIMHQSFICTLLHTHYHRGGHELLAFRPGFETISYALQESEASLSYIKQPNPNFWDVKEQKMLVNTNTTKKILNYKWIDANHIIYAVNEDNHLIIEHVKKTKKTIIKYKVGNNNDVIHNDEDDEQSISSTIIAFDICELSAFHTNIEKNMNEKVLPSIIIVVAYLTQGLKNELTLDVLHFNGLNRMMSDVQTITMADMNIFNIDQHIIKGALNVKFSPDAKFFCVLFKRECKLFYRTRFDWKYCQQQQFECERKENTENVDVWLEYELHENIDRMDEIFVDIAWAANNILVIAFDGENKPLMGLFIMQQKLNKEKREILGQYLDDEYLSIMVLDYLSFVDTQFGIEFWTNARTNVSLSAKSKSIVNKMKVPDEKFIVQQLVGVPTFNQNKGAIAVLTQIGLFVCIAK